MSIKKGMNVKSKSKSIPITEFGKDHFSLLAYVECRCVDNKGELERKHLRCNTNTHLMLADVRYRDPELMDWKSEYGTRLKGYFKGNEKDVSCRLNDHDDYDCLDDLEEAGLIEIISLVNGFIRMTPFGTEVAAKLREHKAKGGMFATFSI
jgi:hypothetical protein